MTTVELLGCDTVNAGAGSLRLITTDVARSSNAGARADVAISNRISAGDSTVNRAWSFAVRAGRGQAVCWWRILEGGGAADDACAVC